MPVCYQVNLQQNFGGGEVYTRFLSEALLGLGWDVELFVPRGVHFWRDMGLQAVRIREITDDSQIIEALPAERSLLVTHTAVSPKFAAAVTPRHFLTGFVHMPLFERNPVGLRSYSRLFGVSRHVIESAKSIGLDMIYPVPMYGVADLQPRPGGEAASIRSRNIYDWDRRKARDRMLGLFSPVLGALGRGKEFLRRPGLTLGIVSRITPIKQFPELFAHIVPVLQRYPSVSIEIFGSGGYASIRDLRNAVGPIRSRVRFWGHQGDVGRVYRQMDYVLSGLPEKEALGLNLIEAQACGTPVLAVDAPPFTETVIDGESGYLYPDPRTDAASGFERVLTNLLSGASRPDPRLAKKHMAQFSVEAFQRRLQVALAAPQFGA